MEGGNRCSRLKKPRISDLLGRTILRPKYLDSVLSRPEHSGECKIPSNFLSIYHIRLRDQYPLQNIERCCSPSDP